MMNAGNLIHHSALILQHSCQWTAGESNPDCLGANQASSHWTSGPYHREVRPGVEPDLSPYRGGVLPKHLQTIFNNSDPGWSRTIALLVVAQASFAVGPRDRPYSSVTGVGLEPTGTRLSTSPLCQFAYPAVKVSIPERGRLARSSERRHLFEVFGGRDARARRFASGGSGGCTRRSELMRLR